MSASLSFLKMLAIFFALFFNVVLLFLFVCFFVFFFLFFFAWSTFSCQALVLPIQFSKMAPVSIRGNGGSMMPFKNFRK